MIIVKTWSESTKETLEYLRFNGYKNPIRISKNLYVCKTRGKYLADVEILNLKFSPFAKKLIE